VGDVRVVLITFSSENVVRGFGTFGGVDIGNLLARMAIRWRQLLRGVREVLGGPVRDTPIDGRFELRLSRSLMRAGDGLEPATSSLGRRL
jgi:hypothetical protein